jgi:hypothetical protein
MVVFPSGKALPLAGPPVWVMLAPLQLSVAVGTAQEATAVQAAPAFTVMVAGQLIVGALASTTVTVKEQVLVLPAASVAV